MYICRYARDRCLRIGTMTRYLDLAGFHFVNRVSNGM